MDGTIVTGPVNIRKLNAEIIKNHPELLSDKLHQSKVKLIATYLKQEAPFPNSAKAEAKVLTFTTSAEVRVGVKARMKVLGIGGEVKVGVSKTLIETELSDQGSSSKTPADTKWKGDGSLGVGPVAAGVEGNLDGSDLSVSGNLGPYQAKLAENGFENENVTLLDVGGSLLLGGEVKLQMNRTLFNEMIWGAHIPEGVQPNPSICYPDATSVSPANNNIPPQSH